MNDIYSLLVRLKNIGVTLETNLVHDIVNKLESGLTVDGVYELLDNLKEIGVKLGENTAVCIVNKLKSGLTLDNVSTLLKKFRNINVQLNSNIDGYGKDNVVDAIVGKLQSPQSAQSLLDLVKTLQKFNIQPIANTCKQILNLLDGEQNAGNVADLLINLGNLVEFDKIQAKTIDYLPGIDNILDKIDSNQSEENMLKLAKVLIKMGKNLQLYSEKFKGKIMCYSSNIELEKLFEEKPTAVLKIFGGIFAILGILCIISSLIIAESVLLGSLIPGCGLLTAGIISILVELFLNNKNDKPPINLSIDDLQPESSIFNPDNNIDLSINLETDQNISRDNNES